MDPSLCRNPDLFRRWESSRERKILASYLPFSSGSGFIIGDGSIVLTNRHVVEIEDLDGLRNKIANALALTLDEAAQKSFTTEERRILKLDLFSMLTKGKYRFSATIGGTVIPDPARVAVARKGEADIAVLKIPPFLGRALRMASPESISSSLVGKEVFSFGFPLGMTMDGVFGETVVTMNKGNVSALRSSDLGIQHSAAISRGNSGGPLVDSEGTVLGMNTASMEEGNSLFFAVGTDRIRDFLVKRGIAFEPAPPKPQAPAAVVEPTPSPRPVEPQAVPPQSAGQTAASVPASTRPAEIEVSASVFVESERGARVWLDGVEVGSAPVVVTVQSPVSTIRVRGSSGVYTAKLRLAESRKGTTILKADLTPSGNLVISSNEDQVRVLADGIELGPFGSGVFEDLAAGERRIELVGKDLYGTHQVVIPAGSTAQLNAVVHPAGKLAIKAPLGIRIRTAGPQSSFLLDPSNGPHPLPAGEYELSAEGGDFQVESVKISVRKGETSTWEPYSQGALGFEITPAGAVLVLGGTTVPTDKELTGYAPGSYTAILRKPGYRDIAVSFTVTAGKRTVIRSSLEELTRGAVVIPKVGCPVAIEFEKQSKLGKDSTDGTMVFEGIPAGYPLRIAFRSPASEGGNLDIPEREIHLKEGETLSLTIPTGKFTLPWIPAGASVELGRDARFSLEGGNGLQFVSPPLPPGRYPLRIEGGPLANGLDMVVTITAGAAGMPEGVREAMTAALTEAKAKNEKTLSKHRTRTRIGVASLGAGALGAAGGLVCYLLGSQAMDSYRAATDTATATARWKTVEMWQTLFFTSAGLGGVGFGLSPVFLAGRTDTKSLQDSIRALDEGLEALGK